jgi:hypothetical protein
MTSLSHDCVRNNRLVGEILGSAQALEARNHPGQNAPASTSVQIRGISRPAENCNASLQKSMRLCEREVCVLSVKKVAMPHM